MADDPDTRPRPTPLMPPSFFTKEPRHLDSPMEWSTSLLRQSHNGWPQRNRQRTGRRCIFAREYSSGHQPAPSHRQRTSVGDTNAAGSGELTAKRFDTGRKQPLAVRRADTLV
jgi:hypothetical protein